MRMANVSMQVSPWVALEAWKMIATPSGTRTRLLRELTDHETRPHVALLQLRAFPA